MAAAKGGGLVFPKITLDVAVEWMENHCMVPDGDAEGTFFKLREFQHCYIANHYAVKRTAKPGMLSAAFVHRRSLLMDAQKKGKSPLLAAQICLEAVGPALFAGWAEGGELYDCRNFGCGCGWQYEYAPGEPMGKPWATPLIQLTATSYEQTDNTYDALRPMIDNGPLAMMIPNTGEEMIRLPGGKNCYIAPVTSKANSRLGARLTFAPWDETGIYFKENGMWKVFTVQKRGLTLMGGRGAEMTNCYDPAEDSVAKATYESTEKDIYKQYVEPPKDLDFFDNKQRLQLLKFNYADAPWALRNIGAVDSDAKELMKRDPAEAERFYGNRLVVGQGHWIRETDWMRKSVRPRRVPAGTMITLGIDLSNNNDWTGIRAETADHYQFTPTYGDAKLPTIWRPTDFGGRIPRTEVNAAIDYLCNHFTVVRAYVDPAGSAKGASAEDDAVEDDSWRLELKEWQVKYQRENPKTGKLAPVFFPWETYVLNKMHAALETFRASVLNPDKGGFTHDGCETTKFHVRNAVVRNRTGQRYMLGKPSEHQKIDLTQSAVLAHEASMDAMLAEEFTVPEEEYAYVF